MVIQGHCAQNVSEMTGPNIKDDKSRAGAEIRKKRRTGEVDRHGQGNFPNIIMKTREFQRRIKRGTTPTSSNRITVPHLRDLF